MRFTVLASGSKGNAALIESDSTRLLIDCGLSAKELAKRMAPGPPFGSLDGDFVICTHCHIDHIGCLPVVVRSAIRRGNALPVYLTPLTAAMIDWDGLECPPVRHFEAGQPFQIGDIQVEPFSVPHDATDPVGFVFSAGIRIGFATDLGFVPPAMQRKFSDCDVILIESNHDIGMLESGPHPPEVKERVAGRFGHLSNDQVAEFLVDVGPKTHTVVLAHLSEDNNVEALAEWSARKALLAAGSSAVVMIARQSERLLVL